MPEEKDFIEPKKEKTDWNKVNSTIALLSLLILFFTLPYFLAENTRNLTKLQDLNSSITQLRQEHSVLFQGEQELANNQRMISEKDSNEHVILARLIIDLNERCK